MTELHVVSLSGGKDSTAMLLMMLEKGMRVDDIIFSDTGKEFPQMYDHLEQVEKFTGRTITRLTHEYTFDYLMFEHKRESGSNQHIKGYGWAFPQVRWCTGEFKGSLIRKYINSIKGRRRVFHYVGIAADEPSRIKNEVYPLFDWDIDERQALQYCYSKGFHWGGLYQLFSRVSCWCCPLQNIGELRNLYHYFPDLWAELKEMDRKAYNQFKENYSVLQLEERFRNEDAQVPFQGYFD